MASLRVLSSFEGMNYARASYQTQLRDATVGVAYSWLDYKLGKEFSPLRADGTATVLSAFASYPLIRSYRTNLNGLLLGEAKSFEDNIGATDFTSKKSARALTAGLNGEHRDTFGGGGLSFFALNATVGDLDIKTDAVRAIDAVTARTNGSYQKLAFEAGRLQQVAGPLSLYGAVKGQVASKNLDPSEKMELGGAYNVRAYPEGEAFGDEGYVATLEARMMLPQWPMPGRLQAFAFVDHGQVTLNKDPWAAGENHRSLSGAGAGLTWAEANNFMVKVSYAMKLGNEDATSAPDRNGRLWVQLSKFF
jgi:hemolysin activation/secretion protein